VSDYSALKEERPALRAAHQGQLFHGLRDRLLRLLLQPTTAGLAIVDVGNGAQSEKADQCIDHLHGITVLPWYNCGDTEALYKSVLRL
jgi:hypothetical protein